MTRRFQLYKCNVCGNITEVVNEGSGQLVCCAVPMELLEEHNNDDNAQEKHVPVVTLEGENKTIRIGKIAHPMIKEHYIIFIEAISSDKKYVQRKYLYPNDKPKMDLKRDCGYESFTARELCNIHGLWVLKNQNI